MMTTTPLDLEGIRRRCSLASPGPWWPEVESDDGTATLCVIDILDATGKSLADEDGCFARYDDLLLMAHARADIPALLAIVDRAVAFESAFREGDHGDVCDAAEALRVAIAPTEDGR